MPRTKAQMEITVEMFRRLEVGIYSRKNPKDNLPNCLRGQPLLDLAFCLDAPDAIPAGSMVPDPSFGFGVETCIWRGCAP